jgi:chromosomal replication initiator protein
LVQPAPNNLNKAYTFNSFIKGANNEFAKSAAQSVAESPGKNSFNPLIIYGGVGLGKTHLIHSIGNKIHEKDPRSKVVIVTSEKFTLDFVNSLRKNRTIEFAQQYRNADVLLIDDIQFFRGKEQTQEQFFHTFNVLQQAGKQIVMTTDKYPAEIKGLQERLLSRFQSGLSVDIQPPNLEIRIAILLEKAEQNGIRLDYNIIEFIAKHIKKNVRDLEGAIIRVLAKSSLMNKEIDFQLVKEVIRERIGSSFSPELSIEDVVKKVSEISKVSEIEIVGKSRKMEVAEARQVSMYLCRKIIGTSLNNIGVYFGGRDHSTVIHAVKTINDKINNKKHIKEQIEAVKQELDFSLM